ncbi:hypothetical protein HU200_036135 [Digitaria exilis]|uniref:WAT1-related protein n=1 Tax=Digitaria exilis TaxID=1010633 RepID=A0A835EL64_9POAL|nr:hypothetical protein HU200_036135 [Digitaria exilis]
MDEKKPYIIAIIIQVIYTGMFVVNKAALDHGMNSFVFIFYRQGAASLLLLPIAVILERRNARSMSFLLLLKLFICALIGITISLNLYNVGLKLTTATVASATTNSLPVITFCLALLLRMEDLKLRSRSGIAKLAGVALCLAGVLVIAFYSGPFLSPVNHHRAFSAGTHASITSADSASRSTWIKGTFMAVLAIIAWSVWIVLQAAVLKEFPNKMLVTVTQCLFSVVQSFVVAVVAERDFSKWKLRPDIGLLAIAYSGLVVFGVSYYLQAWCVEMKGPVFLAAWAPLGFILTMFCSSFFLGEMVHLGSIIGGILLSGGLYSVLWGKSKENKTKNIEVIVSNRASQDDELVHMGVEEKEKKNSEEERDVSSAFVVGQVRTIG